ncbi:MAG: DegT/DnrJ/EryC1/StrS family aminotransferase [Patescibacteria group bacterium]
MNIPITKPYFDDKEARAVAEVLKTGWVVQGPKVTAFEIAISKFTGAPYSIATSSCTTGLHLCLRALEIGPADEVIVPAFTFIASANACEYVGAKPIFVDIELETFNLDPEKITEKITKKTRAIMPVHLFGLAANMGEILKIARKFRLKIIEDAACGIGTKYLPKGKAGLNRHVGTIGDMGALSFHPRKSITTGEGGMVMTKTKNLAEKIKSLRDHGAVTSDLARHKKQSHQLSKYPYLGYNYRLTDIQASIGLEQVKKLKKILNLRIEKAQKYNQTFKNHPYLQPPFIPAYSNHAYQSYVLLLKKNSPLKRDEIAEHLSKIGIAVRQGTQNVPLLDFYRKKYGFKKTDFPNALYAEKNTLTIPLYSQMTEKEQNYVIENILKIFKNPKS